MLIIPPPKVYDTKLERLLALNEEIYSVVWGKIYRRRLWRSLRFPLGVEVSEDTWCLIDVLASDCSFRTTACGYYYYRKRSDSVTHNITPKRWEGLYLANLKRYKALLCESDNGGQLCPYYLYAVRCLTTTQVQYGGRRDATAEIDFLRRHMPGAGCLFSRALPLKDRLWLLCIKTLGLRRFVEAYVAFVRRRTGRK